MPATCHAVQHLDDADLDDPDDDEDDPDDDEDDGGAMPDLDQINGGTA